ncbi:MAG: septum formation initiator family protein [Bacteroidota bacterium]|nr:septum formation initiator family protein [Bacteroidota bacterium]
MKKYLQKIKNLFSNFYITTFVFLFIWVAFFDENDLISQFKLTSKMKDLQNEKLFYETKIKEVKQERAQVLGNSEAVEKYARERYLMKKPTEDIYLAKTE